MREGRFQKWTVKSDTSGRVYQAVAKRMLDYLNNSEVLKVNILELEFHVLAPNEPSVKIEHIEMKASGEEHQRLFRVFHRQ